MEKLKKAIILLSILVVIIIIVILIILKFNTNSYSSGENVEEVGEPGVVIDYEKETTMQLVDNIKFFTISNCVNSYLDIININNSRYYTTNENNERTLVVSEAEINGYICDILSNEYIENNNINAENVRNYVDKIDNNVIFVPLKMNVLRADKIEKYAVYGFLTDINNNYIRDIYLLVNYDLANKAFAIEPLINREYTDINEIEIINNNNPIEKNDNNVIEEAKINYEYLAREYMNTFKRMTLARTELAYEYLDTEYKEKRFGNYEVFAQYVNDNREEISSVALSKYQVVANDNNVRNIICIDNKGNYYIFNEKSIMDFTALLDAHTIQQAEFLERYNSGGAQEKVGMNIELFIDAINTKDYTYAYNLLADSFKSNYYKTQQDFENAIKNNLYSYNDISYDEFSQEGETYIYKVTVTNTLNKNETKPMTIIMQLQEGTDFVMSFSFE